MAICRFHFQLLYFKYTYTHTRETIVSSFHTFFYQGVQISLWQSIL